MPIKLLIYDDNPDRRDSLTLLLQSVSELQVCGSFPDCSHVIEEVMRHEPDVVLMDIQMPNADGLFGVKTIKQHFPSVKVMMQTVFDDDEKVFEALLNGAAGYILKRTSSEKIVEAIFDVWEGGSPMTPSIAAKVLQYFRQPSQQQGNYQLTDKELNILNLLVDGLSYKMIADRCTISYHTVNSHIKKIYEKLQVHSASEAVSKALNERIVVK